MSNDKNTPGVVKGVINRFLQVAVVFIIQAVILFLAAGRLNWIWAWIFLGAGVIQVLITGLFLSRNNLETVAERGRPKETKDWDKTISGLYALFQYLAIPLVAGLDARLGWTGNINIAWSVTGLVIYATGGALGSWAMITNAYFSTAVRIQTDRGHTVCRTGPYRLVRHPGYVGFISQSFGAALLLGSVWTLIPAIIAAALMTIRTSLEDKMLRAELPGYSDYVKDVRYRLVPGIW
jgi:protein-S-isoprenylcysteine O-methyltransferase Ste14